MTTPQTHGENSLKELLQLAGQAFGHQLGDLPAKVVSYDAATQTVDAQPLVLLSTVQGLRPASIARQVQVRWPAGSTWSVVGDLVSGDYGWLRPAGADISAWKMQGAEGDPTAIPRSNSLSDVVFEPGSQPVSTPLPSDAYAAGSLVIKAASLLLGDATATAFVALADLVDTHLSNIQNHYDKHVHAAPAGGGLTATPVSAPLGLPYIIGALASVAATKVKAK